MSSLHISQGTFRLGDTRTLTVPDLTLHAGESWAFVGTNGSGNSALARALAGELTLLKGERQSHFTRTTRLSFEQLQKLVSDEWQRNNTDLLSPGEEDTGRTTATILPVVSSWRSSSASPPFSTAASNTFLPARRVKRCSARR